MKAGYINIPQGLNAATNPALNVNIKISEFNLFSLLSTISLLSLILSVY